VKRLLFLGALGLVAMLTFASVAGAQKASVVGAQIQQKQATRTVLIQNFSFKPAHITIKRGTKVTWINKDTAPHTATATNGKSFHSPVLRKGQSYSHTFKTAGKWGYYCKIHPEMRGSVTVTR
jgi:plastocyanin